MKDVYEYDHERPAPPRFGPPPIDEDVDISKVVTALKHNKEFNAHIEKLMLKAFNKWAKKNLK